MGPLLLREGRAADAIASVCAGEGVLRSVGDREELCKLLCVRGTIEVALGHHERARAALAEAEALAKAMATEPASEVEQSIAALRKAAT